MQHHDDKCSACQDGKLKFIREEHKGCGMFRHYRCYTCKSVFNYVEPISGGRLLEEDRRSRTDHYMG